MRFPKLPAKIPKWVWFALAAVVLGGERVIAREGAQATGEVSARLTPANASQVASAIVRALRAMGRPVARQESWLYPLAVSALETASWKKLWNDNVGNVSAYDTKRQAWYRNPEVTETHYFRAFSSLDAGARAMLETIQRYGGLTSADAADLPGFQVAMTRYLSNPGKSYPDLSSLVASLRGTIVADVA